MLLDDHRGQTFARLCIARAIGGEHTADTIRAAEDLFGRSDPAARILRAAHGSTIPSESWGEELVTYRQAAAEFFEQVHLGSIIGKLTGLRRVPLSVRTVTIADGATAHWVGEGAVKPIVNGAFSADALSPLKLAAITVLTQDLLRLADPQSEATIRADLTRAVVEATDLAFIDPGNSGVTNLVPASVTSGITPVTATGDFSFDFASLIDDFGGDLSTAWLVGHPVLFAKLSGADYPLIGARGGELAGIPAIASKAVPIGESPDTHSLILVDPSGIVIGDGMPSIGTATHASILMIDPDQSPAEAEMISLWQNNLSAIRIEMPTNWKAARPAVSILNGIDVSGQA